MKKYKNLALSVLFLVLTFILGYELVYGNQEILFKNISIVPFVVALVPIFDILGIYFAVRSMKRNESPIGTYLGIIGIIVLISILFIAFMSWSLSHTTW